MNYFTSTDIVSVSRLMESKTPVSDITVVDVARLKRRGLAEDDKIPKKVYVRVNYLFIIAFLLINAHL